MTAIRLPLRLLLLLTVIVPLAGCALFEHPPRPKHRHVTITKAQKEQTSAAQFLLHLSQERLALAANETGAAYLKEAQEEMPSAKESQYVPAIVITYQPKGGERTRIAIPFTQSRDKASFPNLPEVMSKLGTMATLYDIRPAAIRVSGDASWRPTGKAPAVDRQLARLLQQTRKLPPLNDAQVQVRLVEFLVDYRFKEAAYIGLDNAKKSVARALTSVPSQKEALHKLSDELSVLEDQLHLVMPYRTSLRLQPASRG